MDKICFAIDICWEIWIYKKKLDSLVIDLIMANLVHLFLCVLLNVNPLYFMFSFQVENIIGKLILSANKLLIDAFALTQKCFT